MKYYPPLRHRHLTGFLLSFPGFSRSLIRPGNQDRRERETMATEKRCYMRARRLFILCGVVVIFTTAFLLPVKERVRFVDPGPARLVPTERNVKRL